MLSNTPASLRRRTYDEVEVGEVIVSDGITITDAHVVIFAGLVGDFYPLHSNEELAKQSQFGGRIAHATLTLAIAMGLQLQSDPLDAVAFLGLRECRFTAAVKIGDTISVRSTLVSKRLTSRGDRGIVRHRREILNQSGEVVADTETEIMVNV